MAKKKKPVETADVVEIQEPVVEDTPVIEDAVVVDVEPEEADAEAIVEEVETSIVEPLNEPKNLSVVPLILGGVLAAVIGFVAARTTVIDNFLPPSWRTNTGEVVLQEQITSAQSQLDTLNEKLANVSAELAAAPTINEGVVASLSSKVDELAGRLAEIEKRPAAANTDGSEFNDDFASLRDVAEKQQAEIDALLADARLVEQASQDAASKTLARAAATRVMTAIESGAPFASALADLEATGTSEIPDELQAVAVDGVITLAALQDAMPDAARGALAASPVDVDAGIGGFLKRQLGARSVEPRDGNDPDAILSRIEGAVRQGHLNDALAEAETLPPEVKAAMSDWLEDAATRLAVTSASETLMQRLAAN